MVSMGARCRAAAVTCLLMGLCAVRCDGEVSGVRPSPSLQEAASASMADTLQLFWEAMNSTVSEAAGSTCSGVQTGLLSVQSQLESRLESVQSQLESRLVSVQTQIESQLESRLDSVQSQLESRLDSVESQLADVRSELQSSLPPARDCSDLPAGSGSGVHLLQPGLRQPVPAYCDQETDGGGWTVFQRRADIQPRQDFDVGWQDYKWGFGELDGEFWWGLEHLWLMTSTLDRRYQLRFDMEDFDGEKRYALYEGFRISSETDGYRLTAANYSGDANHSFSPSGTRFSTKDKDLDTYTGSCATAYKGGWWFTKCHGGNLNGLYLSGNHTSYANGVNWRAWKGYHYSLKNVAMKIRPSKKL